MASLVRFMTWKDQKWTSLTERGIKCYKTNSVSTGKRKLSVGVFGRTKILASKVSYFVIDLLKTGLTYIKKSSPYIMLLKPFLEKKTALALDAWGATDDHLAPLFDRIGMFFKENISEEDQKRYPWPVWKFESWISRVVRNELLSEFLVPEWARYFRDLSECQLRSMGESFALRNCEFRQDLNKILKANST